MSTTTPNPPTFVTASSGGTQATISWVVPAGSDITSYTVTSTPVDGLSATVAGITDINSNTINSPGNLNFLNDNPFITLNTGKELIIKDTSNYIGFINNNIKVYQPLDLSANGIIKFGNNNLLIKNGNSTVSGSGWVFDTTGNLLFKEDTNTTKWSLKANGDINVSGTISTTSAIDGGAITCTSLSAGSGTISTTGAIGGGAITGTSLSVGSGSISTTGAIGGGAITGTSLSTGSGTITTTGAIGGGAITGTSLSAGSGTISTTGAIGGGDITGASLSVGTGAIGGGAITGTSLSAGSGTISTTGAIGGGAITGASLSVGSGTISTTGAIGGGAITASGTGSVSTSGVVTAGTGGVIQGTGIKIPGGVIYAGGAISSGGSITSGANSPIFSKMFASIDNQTYIDMNNQFFNTTVPSMDLRARYIGFVRPNQTLDTLSKYMAILPSTDGNFAMSINNITANIFSSSYNSSGTSTLRSDWALTAVSYNNNSDKRIKTNIIDINDTSAIAIIRQIQPKIYNYIDVVERGTKPVWGFIAQEIRDILDHSVTITKDFIPDIYELAEVLNTNTIKLNTKTTVNFEVDKKIRLIIENKYVETNITSILDDYTFTVEENISQSTMFVYGREVDDFHTLNKDAIFTVATAALQEVDKELQAEKSLRQLLETRLLDLENKFLDLGNNFIDLRSKNIDLENKNLDLENRILVLENKNTN